MKNRNDDKKYIFCQFRKVEVKRLFDRIDEIQSRTCKSHLATPRNHSAGHQRKILHRHTSKNDLRLYEIKRQNQRLVDKLTDTKITVISHFTERSNKHRENAFILRSTMKQNQIEKENKRYFEAIKRATSNQGFHRKKKQKVYDMF